MRIGLVVAAVMLVALGSCAPEPQPPAIPPDRESLIPPGQTKVLPDGDAYPPRSETEEYKDPVPLPYPVNTAGAEDSAFVMPDGKTLYLWFTPDPKKPLEEQAADGVTGIYVAHQLEGAWGRPQRVLLQAPGRLALDGCAFLQENAMWFCSAREGFTGIHWFTARFEDGKWGNWTRAGFEPSHEVGELHITADGTELYFHSPRPGGRGGFDIWVSENVNGRWQEPKNVLSVNTPHTEGWPFVTQDGSELWFTRLAGAPELYRSTRVDDSQWGTPVKMFSSFAGESSLDIEGNVYFTHHYYRDDAMLEADIYVAVRK